MENTRKETDDKIVYLRNKSHSVMLGVSFIKWILIGAIVGVATGSAAALFLKSLELATDLRVKHTWLLFLLPLGGALVSFLYSKYGKNSSKGNNLIIEKINEQKGTVPLRMAPLVFFGTFITHLFGGSAGREGTGVQIGASLAESIGKLFKLDKVDNRIILMAGISSGFASVFGTPLAGTVFGLEVAALGLMSYEALIPAFTASIVGDVMVALLGVHHTHYKVIGVPELTSMTVLKIAFAAVLFGLTSKLFSELTHKLKEVFTARFENPVMKSVIGGFIVIALVYILGTRDFLGLSIPLISESFNGQGHPLTFLGKIVFTSLTLGTGYQGGEVTPLFVIGSTLGNTLSSILHISPSFLAALGLIGVFAGATNTPIASFILSIEMFGSQGLVFVFMTCAISYMFSGHTGIYASQKIGRSKSRLIEVPHNATLSEFKQHKKNWRKKMGQILAGQFMYGHSSIELPSEVGKNRYKITINGGKVRLNHSSYNPDGHTWSTPPGKGEKQHMDLEEGTHIVDILVSEHYGKKNKIELVNGSLLDAVNIEYVIEPIYINEEELENVN